MTYGVARAATAPELALFRSPGHKATLRAAILAPATVYTGRINQTFPSWDGILEIAYDGGVGTLADVLADMTLLIGSSAGAHDIGICRVRSIDAIKVYIGETSDVRFANDQYLTVIRDFGLWAKHVLISAGVPFMDGGVAYSNQHTLFDPVPIMGDNRILKLESASVSTVFNWASSYVYDSTITGYATSAPTSSSSSGMTTATPTVHFDAVGWHPIYLTLTAANGETFFGVRWVYVWDDDNPPASATINECRCDAETGGWQFSLTLLDNVDLAAVRDRALVILFAEDHYGTTKQSIGPVEGSENVVVTGWIGGEESINWNPEQGEVSFTAYTAQYWLGRIPSFPDGVEFVTGTPTAWTEMQNLTVDKGLWHHLHWRTTATRVMDVFLTGDTKYTAAVESLASNLWEQLREMAFLQIFARPGVNAHNQLFIQVHPQLVPLASRTWPTVMTITKPDLERGIDLRRITVTPNAQIDLWGVSVNSNGVGTPYRSMSPGHTYPHYGSPDLLDRLLVASQAQANSLAGLYRGWQNNELPNIPIVLKANNRLIDCFPNQQCAIVIAEGDTPRGIAYSGNLIPTAVSIVTDPKTGYLHTEVSFEAETFEDIAVTAAVPGSRDDPSVPPLPSLPAFPEFPPVVIPGTIEPGVGGPKKVLLHDATGGVILSENFNTSPTYRQINAGLTQAQYRAINWMDVTPSGAVYVAFGNSTAGAGNFIARAPSIGATFSIIYDAIYGLFAIGINPTVSDYICAVLGATSFDDRKLHAGSGGTLSIGASVSGFTGASISKITYGLGKWLYAIFDTYVTLATNGLSVSGSGNISTGPAKWHVRASTTGRTFHERNGTAGMVIGENNLASHVLISDADIGPGATFDCDPTGTYCMMRYGAGGKGKSSDGANSWAGIGALPVGNWFFAYAGPNGTTPRFIAANAVVRYTPDFGTTWEEKTTTMLTDIAPFPNINRIKVLEF